MFYQVRFERQFRIKDAGFIAKIVQMAIQNERGTTYEYH